MRLLASCLLLAGVVSCLPWEYEDDSRETVRAGLTCNCGWTNRGRIVGGTETGKHEYPFVVALQSHSKHQFCGGTIITEWHVLTAAHCTAKRGNKIIVNVGAHYKGVNTDGHLLKVARVIDHPHYTREHFLNDVSILELVKKIKFTQNVGPACLPIDELNLVGKHIRALGWGRTSFNGTSSEYLQEVDLPVISNDQCSKTWKYLQKTNLCTFSKNKSTGKGDSGGPLVWMDPDTNRYTLAALTSYSDSKGRPLPKVYTDVSRYLTWIKDTIAASTPPTAVCTKA